MVTADTNIAIYALKRDEKSELAEAALANADFLSVQVLNEYAFVCRRKLRESWSEIGTDLSLLQAWVREIKPVNLEASREALRIAKNYQLAFFDALLLAVALNNGAMTFFSEDMQHGLVIDGRLTITNPFLEAR